MTDAPDNPADDAAQEFLTHMLACQRAVRNYLLSLHPDPSDIDDLMQQTALTLWKEFHRYDRSRSFLPWALRIGYFEVLRLRTMRSRDLLVFSNDMIEILAEEELPEAMLQAKRLALQSCLGLLGADDRELLMACYGRDSTVTALAARRNEKPHRLYHQLDRVRRQLVQCVRRQLRLGDPNFS